MTASGRVIYDGRRGPPGLTIVAMRLLVFRFFVLVLAAVLSPGQASSAPRNIRLAQVKSFALALGARLDGNNLSLLSQYDLVVLDGAEATSGEIQLLKNAGVIVLGYLSVGTVERGRPWYSKVKAYRLDFWEDWREWYADVSSSRYRKRILRIGKTLSDKGFDGLFLDNVDAVEVYPQMRTGMRRLMARFAAMLHPWMRFSERSPP